MEACQKIQIDPSLFQLDCDPCQEKPFCGFRANTALQRYTNLLPRVHHAAWLTGVRKALGRLGRLSAWEVRSLVAFEAAVRKAESQESEKRSRDQNAASNR
jgi:hypothetical protein